jgi:hypothetical protein
MEPVLWIPFAACLCLIALAMLKNYDLESFEILQEYLNDALGMDIASSDGDEILLEDVRFAQPEKALQAKTTFDGAMFNPKRKKLALMSDEDIWKLIGTFRPTTALDNLG